MKINLIILGIMILYDLQLHIIELFAGNTKKAWPKWYYWPPTKIFRQDKKKFYNVFWSGYWSVALLLILFIFV